MTDQHTPGEARQRLYEIIRQDVPFDEKARKALTLGTRVLAVDNGHLSRVDTETNHWKAMVTTDADDGLTPPEHELDLRETYCRHTVADNEQLALHDAPEQGYVADPAVENRGLACYLGTPLIIDDEPQGVVCFVANEPRDTPFTDAETRFAEFLSRLLERELAREHVETERASQTNLAAVFNRVLRHNLRNEMSVVRGFTNHMAEELDDDPYSETILDHIDGLIELSETARELERIITTDAEQSVTDIVGVVNHVVDGVQTEYPAAEITVTADEERTTAVRPTFKRAIEELVENAAKHGGDQPTITVAVESVPDAIEVRIVDDGPGLSNQEINMLSSGEETPLAHGSGLGLWLAHWIVTSHDGEIDATATTAGTVMTVSIPERPAMNVDQQIPECTRTPDQYQAVFTEADDAMIIVNDDARIVDANSAAGELFGLGTRDLRGRGLAEFLLPEFDAAWETIRTPGAGRETVRLRADDGIDRFVEYAATSDIVPGQHLVVARDVTDRVTREVERKQKTRALDAAPVGITLADPSEDDTPIIYANDAFCELTGYEAREIIGQNCRFLQGEETNADRVDQLRAGIETGEVVSTTLRNYRKDGTAFWNHVTVAPVTTSGEKLLVGVQQDVSDSIDRPLSPAHPS